MELKGSYCPNESLDDLPESLKEHMAFTNDAELFNPLESPPQSYFKQPIDTKPIGKFDELNLHRLTEIQEENSQLEASEVVEPSRVSSHFNTRGVEISFRNSNIHFSNEKIKQALIRTERNREKDKENRSTKKEEAFSFSGKKLKTDKQLAINLGLRKRKEPCVINEFCLKENGDSFLENKNNNEVVQKSPLNKKLNFKKKKPVIDIETVESKGKSSKRSVKDYLKAANTKSKKICIIKKLINNVNEKRKNDIDNSKENKTDRTDKHSIKVIKARRSSFFSTPKSFMKNKSKEKNKIVKNFEKEKHSNNNRKGSLVIDLYKNINLSNEKAAMSSNRPNSKLFKVKYENKAIYNRSFNELLLGTKSVCNSDINRKSVQTRKNGSLKPQEKRKTPKNSLQRISLFRQLNNIGSKSSLKVRGSVKKKKKCGVDLFSTVENKGRKNKTNVNKKKRKKKKKVSDLVLLKSIYKDFKKAGTPNGRVKNIYRQIIHQGSQKNKMIKSLNTGNLLLHKIKCDRNFASGNFYGSDFCLKKKQEKEKSNFQKIRGGKVLSAFNDNIKDAKAKKLKSVNNNKLLMKSGMNKKNKEKRRIYKSKTNITGFGRISINNDKGSCFRKTVKGERKVDRIKTLLKF